MSTLATQRSSPAGAGRCGCDPDGDALMERVQRLSAEVDRIGDPAARESAQDLLSAVMDLYGEGLERIVGTLADSGEAGESIRRRLSEDGVVASLMLIHDLYPVELETRVLEALEGVRPYMESHGGNVTLISLEDGVALAEARGQLRRLPGLGFDPGAGDQAGARRSGPRPGRSRGRGRHRGPVRRSARR